MRWLLKTDRFGNRSAMARRLGIQYMIWNRRSGAPTPATPAGGATVPITAGLRGWLHPAAAEAIVLVGLTGCTSAAARAGADAAAGRPRCRRRCRRRRGRRTAGAGRGGYESVRASKAAVAEAAAALVRCGFGETGDPRLGTASVELARPADDTTAGDSGVDQRAMVLAAEGATVILVATGSSADPGAWESLADVALGTSCAAAAHGGH